MTWNVVRAAAGVAVVVAGFLWVRHEWLKKWQYEFRPRAWHAIEPGLLFRSGQISPRLVENVLRENRIQVIVALTERKADSVPQDAEDRAAKKLGIEQHRFVLNGNGTGDIRMYAQALDAMIRASRAGKPCLVHCGAGTERTGAATVFYRLLVEQWPGDKAYGELVACGWNPDKNRILVDYVNQHISELAAMLVADGTLERVPDPVPRITPGTP